MDTDWSRLPVDLFMQQVTYLPYDSIIALCSTNVQLHNYCSVNNNRWKPLILSTFGNLPNFDQTLKNMQKHLFGGADLYDYQVYTQLQANLLDPITQGMILFKQGDMDSFDKLDPEVKFLALFLLNRRDIIRNYVPENIHKTGPDLNYLNYIYILDGKEKYYHNLSDLAAVFSKWGNLRGVKLMKSKGAQLKDALREASIHGHLNMVKYLIERENVDVHSYNDMAVREAARNGHLDIVKYLVGKGANIHEYNDIALRGAINRQHQDVVDYLRSLP